MCAPPLTFILPSPHLHPPLPSPSSSPLLPFILPSPHLHPPLSSPSFSPLLTSALPSPHLHPPLPFILPSSPLHPPLLCPSSFPLLTFILPSPYLHPTLSSPSFSYLLLWVALYIPHSLTLLDGGAKLMVADRENGRLITMATAKLSHVVSVIENFTALGSRLFAVAAPATTPGGTVCMRACVHACVCVCVCVCCVCVCVGLHMNAHTLSHL